MKLETMYVAILGVAAIVGASSIESDDFIYINPRSPDPPGIRYPPLVPRNRCKKHEDRCGHNCCPKNGMCGIIGPNKYRCYICPKPRQHVCGGECCDG